MNECQSCGLPFAKRAKEKPSTYKARKYCSRKCAATGLCVDGYRYPPGAKCILGDGKDIYCRGWCRTHYARFVRHGDPLTVKNILGDDERRFREKVDAASGPEDCWPWTGNISPEGYGNFSIGGRTEKAHIYAYILANGSIISGREVDHVCHKPVVCNLGNNCPHRRCCNPLHLEAVTPRENILRSNCTKLSDENIAALYQRWHNGEVKEDLAREAGINSTTLERRFRILRGVPPRAGRRTVRAAAAVVRETGGTP